ncbi:PDZ domain-containing protein [Taibaiella lutea]|uniref:Phosphate transporter n=1 Tax=Taibaiella lutea TaxID=2608001 RepID=A0A5M6CQX4_9BACT|nr:inorganic phosphate transporter [Taibaiella lutea]KAA5537363.1 PDZ domain-containing protein [Taibaiella lutea]
MSLLLIIIIILALIFDYINGFHDAANSIATIVSTKVLTPFQAVLWAALFNFVAFFIFKDHGVANTIAKTVKEGQDAAGVPFITLTVICAGLIASIVWNLITWWFGIPSSSSHTLIGGFAGAAIAHAGFGAIEVGTIIKITSFIFLAPLIGLIMAFIISVWFLNSFRKSILPKIVSVLVIAGSLFMISQCLETSTSKILGVKKTEKSEKGLVIKDVVNKTPAQVMGLKKDDIVTNINPVNVINERTLDAAFNYHKQDEAIVINVIRDGKPVQLETTYQPRFASRTISMLVFGENVKWLLIAFIATAMAIFSLFFSIMNYAQSERWFKRMQLVSSAAFSIGHGGNDSQKVMGIITVALIAGGQINNFEAMPTWVPLACYTVIALGTMSGGWKIIKTMGTRITKVTPFEGVAAETAGALTLFITEMLKIPVSTTHTITGSIIGVGATKRLSAVRWGVTINLLWAWIITIPISALMAALVYWVLKLTGVGV